MASVLTRFLTGSVHAYDFSGIPLRESAVTPAAVFPVDAGVEPRSISVAPDLRRAVYTTDAEMVCLDRDGNTLWQHDFGPDSPSAHVPRADCRFSLDGTVVWLYQPDNMAGRDDVDRWVTVTADTGTVIARIKLDTAGEGAHHHVHPDGEHMLLDVGEGQDGSRMYRARLHQDVIELTEYPWTDRVLVSLSPDGRHFMTVDQDQGDVAFHAYPDGDTVTRVPAESFGHPDDSYVEWSGGYLDNGLAVVVIGGEAAADEWYRHHIVDVRTGQVRGALDTPSRDMYDLEPLGDGSWLSTHDDDTMWRHTP